MAQCLCKTVGKNYGLQSGVRAMVTRQSGVSITNFKDVPCYELRPRGVMVRVLARDTKGSRVRLPAVPLSANNLGQVVHTHVPLSPSSIICYRGQEAVLPCGWTGNRRCRIAQAMRYRLEWFTHIRAHGLDGETSTPPLNGVWPI